jgi:hypothetical protein
MRNYNSKVLLEDQMLQILAILSSLVVQEYFITHYEKKGVMQLAL